MVHSHTHSFFFFFNDTATTEIYTLSLHDALPICFQRVQVEPRYTLEFRHGREVRVDRQQLGLHRLREENQLGEIPGDRKSTRLNSSHQIISYAVFCLKKKK